MVSNIATGDIQVGILHPGQMGGSIAAAIKASGHVVHWVGAGRSEASRNRANRAGLADIGSLASLCAQCRYIISVCPPEEAPAMARQVADNGFSGIYIDCNAVSPASSRLIDGLFEGSSVSYVDGGIIGPPPMKSGTTRLYLSGEKATEVASLFSGSVVDARVLGAVVGSASALKMAYAGWTKGSSALLMNQYALARQQGIESALLEEWSISLPGLQGQLHSAVSGSAPKAWRFVGEMNEIADTLSEAGLSRLWFEGAAETYNRLVDFKNREDVQTGEVIDALLSGNKKH